MSSFFEFYNRIHESSADFFVGEIQVQMLKVADEVYLFEDSVPRNPDSMQSFKNPEPMTRFGKPLQSGRLADPKKMQKWRVTYKVNDQEVTNYLTAQSRAEAMRMVYDYLKDKFSGEGDKPLSRENKQSIITAAKNSDISPVGGHDDLDKEWNELVRLFQYSLKNDYKINRKGETGKFGSIDNGDLHQLLTFVQANPEYAQEHMQALPPDLQKHMSRAYNITKERTGVVKSNLGQTGIFKGDTIAKADPATTIDPDNRHNSWGSKLRGLFDKHRKTFDTHFNNFRIRTPKELPGGQQISGPGPVEDPNQEPEFDAAKWAQGMHKAFRDRNP